MYVERDSSSSYYTANNFFYRKEEGIQSVPTFPKKLATMSMCLNLKNFSRVLIPTIRIQLQAITIATAFHPKVMVLIPWKLPARFFFQQLLHFFSPIELCSAMSENDIDTVRNESSQKTPNTSNRKRNKPRKRIFSKFYNTDWEKERPWLKPSAKGISSKEYCIALARYDLTAISCILCSL